MTATEPISEKTAAIEEPFLLINVQKPDIQVEATALRRQAITLKETTALCILFMVADVSKMIASYSLKYYNNGNYPLHQTLLVALTEGSKSVVTALAYIYFAGTFRDFKPSLKFFIPSVIYFITNNIFLFALYYVTPAVWIVLVQSKVFLTLLAYRYVFKQAVTVAQWSAGVLIVVAIYSSQLEHMDGAESKGKFIAVLLGLLNGLLSTIASVYTEFLYKNDVRNIWEQQTQIYFISSVLSLLFGFTFTEITMERTETKITCLLIATILLSTVQGITTAAVVKKLDNIVKYQASAVCNILNSIFSALLFPDKFTFTVSYILSLFLLFIAIYLYETKDFVLPKFLRPKKSVVYEKEPPTQSSQG